MGVLLIVVAVCVVGALAGVTGALLASRRADRVRRVDDKAGSTLDEYRFLGANKAALPYRNRDFDKPR